MFDPKNKVYRGQDKKDGSNTDLANKNDFTSKLIYRKKVIALQFNFRGLIHHFSSKIHQGNFGITELFNEVSIYLY